MREEVEVEEKLAFLFLKKDSLRALAFFRSLDRFSSGHLEVVSVGSGS